MNNEVGAVIVLRGPPGVGKTSLAQLLVDKLGGEWAWAGFRMRDPRQIAYHLKRAASEIKVHGLSPWVVLDDLDLYLLLRLRLRPGGAGRDQKAGGRQQGASEQFSRQ